MGNLSMRERETRGGLTVTVTVVEAPASTTTTLVENETRALAPETAEGEVEGRTSVR